MIILGDGHSVDIPTGICAVENLLNGVSSWCHCEYKTKRSPAHTHVSFFFSTARIACLGDDLLLALVQSQKKRKVYMGVFILKPECLLRAFLRNSQQQRKKSQSKLGIFFFRVIKPRLYINQAIHRIISDKFYKIIPFPTLFSHS